MSILHINHIKSALEKELTKLIDISDVTTTKAEEREKNLLSRALAAYTIQLLAIVSSEIAAKSVTDGYDDNGIDAIFFDKAQKMLWVVQSKWIQNGNGEPDNGETLKFIQGIRNLLDLKFENFNAKIKAKESEITEALSDVNVRIQIVLAYTGQSFSEHNKRSFDTLLEELNDPTDLVAFTRCDLKALHASLIQGLDGSPINLEIALSKWGQIDTPHQAFYGQVSAHDIAMWWRDYRRRLFSDNIRSFIGLTEVNEAILGTLKTASANFLYFNNGITLLAKSIKKKAIGGNDRDSGIFVCEGISIVNGAQTVGSIGTLYEQFPKIVEDGHAKVLVKMISLQNCPADFGIMVTKATNTQNKIEKRDFVTLDPQQERLRMDLALNGITYDYIRSDTNTPSDAKHCSLEEAIIGLACANKDINLAVQTKREIGKLWEDTTKKPYTDIINPEVTATYLWRCIQLLRRVNEYLKDNADKNSGRKKGVFIHANRFLLCMVFQQIPTEILKNPSANFDGYIATHLSNIMNIVSTLAFDKTEALYASSLIHQVFRNFTKCTELEKQINGDTAITALKVI